MTNDSSQNETTGVGNSSKVPLDDADDEFQDTKDTGYAWVVALSGFTAFAIYAPVATMLVNRFSVRFSLILATCLSSIGYVSTAYTTDFHWLFFNYSVLQGFARALVLTPAFVCVTMYFEKRQGQVQAFATSGAGFGALLMVPLTQWLMDTYQFQGAFLLLGGVAMHGFVCALLFRPFTLHLKFNKRNNNSRNCSLHHKISKKTGYKLHKFGEFPQTNFDYISANSEEDDQHRKHHDILGLLKKILQSCSSWFRHVSLVFSPCLAVDRYDKSHHTRSKVFHFSIFKHAPFVTACLSVVFYKLGNKTFLDFLPATSLEAGLTSGQMSVLLSIVQIADMGGKLAIGFAMDTELLRPYLEITYIAMLFMLAVLNGAVPLLREFSAFGVLGGVYGLLSGASTIQRTMVVARMVDPDVLASCYGVLYGFQGLGTLVGPPVAGS
ncbi:hypothetical protein EGW08_012606, partial [Elysia chlorotica]